MTPPRLHHLRRPAWAVLLGLVAALPGACSTPFSSCEETKTCEDSGGGGADSGGEGGAPSSCQPACGDSTVCNEATSQCVECLTTQDCVSGVCDPDTKSCVDCLEHTDCTTATKPLCSDQTCIGCEAGGPDASDCKLQLDLAVCLPSGACVECETATAAADCGGKVCDPSTNTCTGTDIHGKQVCEGCAHDADCQEGQACVEMSFDDPSPSVVGTFCLWKLATPPEDGGPGGVSCNAFKGFTSELSAASAEGPTTDFCAPVTTCLAYSQVRVQVNGCTSPANDAACGVPELNDGLCEGTDAAARCTIACFDSFDCPAPATCTAGKYCSL